MNYRLAKIDFYQKPKVCCNAFHKLNFSNEDDGFNPFAKCNYYASTTCNVTKALYGQIVDYIMHRDLNDDRKTEIAKSCEIAKLMTPFLKKQMDKSQIEFKKSSKYFLQSVFAKMTMENKHSKMSFYFQLIGTSQKNKVELSSASFLKLIVE